MASDPITTISVHESTLRMLRPFKRGEMTWDDVLIDFIEEHVPQEFVREMVRRSENEPSLPWREVRDERKRRGH